VDTLELFRTRLRAATPRQVSVGYMTVHLLDADQLEGEQFAYARHPDGRDLTGMEDGDWRRSWVVFAHEDMCGDPIFTDLDAEDFPVFTAAHGTGSWDPTLIAGSFDGFVAALREVQRLSHGREHPVALEAHPLTAAERGHFTKALRVLGKNASHDFWVGWFEID
jgi:hypothetical protein